MAARRAERAQALSMMRGTLAKVLVCVAAAWVLFTQVFGLVRVDGAGMSPTAGDGDLALTWRLVWVDGIVSDDIVVYFDDEGTLQMGRVIAQPGDTVEVTDDGEVLVNGSAVEATSGEDTLPDADSGVVYPLVLGEDEYFVLGDGRTWAVDSRTLGAIGLDEVEGKVVALLRLRGI